jgi:hypothetical protein
MLDLVNCNPKLLLPVQQRASCVWACVVLDLVCEPAKVTGDLLDARNRVLRRHSASLTLPGRARRAAIAVLMTR